jgi:hypothetical protein
MSVENRRQPVKQQSINRIKNIFSHKGMYVKLLYCVWQWCGCCQPGIFINTVWFQTFIRILLGNAMSSFINNHQRLVLPNSWSCMFHSNEQLCIWFDLHNKQWWPADGLQMSVNTIKLAWRKCKKYIWNQLLWKMCYISKVIDVHYSCGCSIRATPLYIG